MQNTSIPPTPSPQTGDDEPNIPITPSTPEGQQALRSLGLSRMLLPVALGLAAVAYLFYSQFNAEQFHHIRWTGRTFGWLALALALLVVRHFFYTLRLRTLTGGAFSWRKCLELMVIWEFSSSLTPTSKGGPFVMMFVLTQEKLSAARTAAAVFYAMVCDAGFFVLSLPFLLAIYGPLMLYPGATNFSQVWLASGVFFSTYALMSVYWCTLVFFLFIRPRYAKNVLDWLARRRFLKKQAPKLLLLGEEFTLAAKTMRGQPWKYHLRVMIGTVGAWTFKFLMINCLLIAIVPTTPLDGNTQAFVYARMVAMFTILTAAPTPGGAGLAELLFAKLISDFVPEAGIAMVIALIWRGMAYYGYLLLGALVVPGWIAAKMFRKKD